MRQEPGIALGLALPSVDSMAWFMLEFERHILILKGFSTIFEEGHGWVYYNTLIHLALTFIFSLLSSFLILTPPAQTLRSWLGWRNTWHGTAGTLLHTLIRNSSISLSAKILHILLSTSSSHCFILHISSPPWWFVQPLNANHLDVVTIRIEDKCCIISGDIVPLSWWAIIFAPAFLYKRADNTLFRANSLTKDDMTYTAAW